MRKQKVGTQNKVFARCSQGRLASTLVVVGMLLSACNFIPPTEKPVTGTLVKPTITGTMPATETVAPTATATETVEPTPTVEATSVTFSEKYPVLWSESYTAKVGGMEIPIDIGLTHWVMNRSDAPISEIHIAEDMVNKVGDYFMHMCFWRYTQLLDHPDVTYEQYLDLVAKGEGKLEIATYDEDKPDQKEPEVTLIDPRKGFSFAWVDRDLPIEYYIDTYRFGSSKEKILLMQNLSGSKVVSYKSCPLSEEICLSYGLNDLFVVNTLSLVGYLANVCIERETLPNGCGAGRHPQELNELWKSLFLKDMLNYENGLRSAPFWIVQ